MEQPLATITGFLSVRTNTAGQRVWAAFCHNSPLCADTDQRTAQAVALETFGRCTLSVWDGDKGEYTHELPTESK